jgi:hypothetical protein
MPVMHISEDLLDRYAMGILAGESLAGVEEHLLSCLLCQRRLLETDEFLNVFRHAAVQADARPNPARLHEWMRWGVAAMASAAAAIVLLVFAAGPPRAVTPPPVAVVLQSLRGPESGPSITAGKPYVLVFDVAISSPQSRYEMEVVDPLGKQVLKTNASVRDGRLTAPVGKLARGAYWVRVYRQQEQELIAEYGLRVK